MKGFLFKDKTYSSLRFEENIFPQKSSSEQGNLKIKESNIWGGCVEYLVRSRTENIGEEV